MKLNCDLGEGEPPALGRALLEFVQLVNVACGGHAGSAATMDRYAAWCRSSGRLLGAHPGLRTSEGRGRVTTRLDGRELELLLLQQVGALERVARHHRVSLHHLKLHGALYHATEANAALARAYVRAVAKWWPRLRIVALAGGRVVTAAGQAGLAVLEEAFADRRYNRDGTLVPRGRARALLGVAEAVAQGREIMATGVVQPRSGEQIRVRAQTLCLHSDTPGALLIARGIASGRFRSPG